MFGLLERDFKYINLAMDQLPEIDKAIVFGSRALGNYKKGSDIDIAILGNDITRKTILKLCDLLNEHYPLPYFFDVIHYDKLTNANLKNHIDKEGKLLYTRFDLI